MSSSLRFLGLAIFAWAGVRAVSLGLVPGAEALAFDRPSKGQLVPPPSGPPIALAYTPPVGAAAPAFVPPPGSAGAAATPYGMTPYGYPPQAYPPYAYVGYAYPTPSYAMGPTVRYVIQAPTYRAAAQSPAPIPQVAELGPMPPPRWMAQPTMSDTRDERLALSAPVPSPTAQQSTPPLFEPPGRKLRPYDRLQLSSWAMMRERPGPASLASNGTLGGSQAGARLLWRFDPHLAASLRVSSPLQSAQRGTEAALGIRYQPLLSIPLAVTIERRQWVGKTPGRSGFAALAEGGVYDRKIALGASLDAYLQAGMVGPKDRAWFVDGSAVVSRPVWRNTRVGAGIWGGAQTDLARFEVGPRLTLPLGHGLKAHADYRFKLMGKAEPGSGAVMTLAGDF